MCPGRLEDPPVNVPTAFVAHDLEGCTEEIGSDRSNLVSMVRMDDELEGPRSIAARELCVGHGVFVARLPGEETGKSLSAALCEIEPEVVGEWPVPVGSLGGTHQLADIGDLVGRELPLDHEGPHSRNLSVLVARPARAAPSTAGDSYTRDVAERGTTPGWDVRGSRSTERVERTTEIRRRLAIAYPEAECELTHESPFQLLAATILSAQTTDVRVNMVTPALFERYPDAETLAEARIEDVEQIIRTVGLYPSKARNLIGMARMLVDEFDGEVPRRRDDLVTLPGVGRKTANVVRSVAFGLPGLAVDTHVGRLSKRLGLTRNDDPVKVEFDLNALVPPTERGRFSLRLILHGRRVCDARKPACDRCLLADLCPARTTSSHEAVRP
mgnify:CR=1 FL=1